MGTLRFAYFLCPLPSAFSGQSSRTSSNSPSIESLSGGRGQSTSSPPPPSSRGSDVSTSSPPPSTAKKESFFNITRSRSHSKSMGKKETVSLSPLSFSCFFFGWRVELVSHVPLLCGYVPLSLFLAQEEDLEAQVSFLQGQINDLEAMSKYCAKMMNTHICELHTLKPACLKQRCTWNMFKNVALKPKVKINLAKDSGFFQENSRTNIFFLFKAWCVLLTMKIM